MAAVGQQQRAELTMPSGTSFFPPPIALQFDGSGTLFPPGAASWGINVRDYGATGNGSTDDAASIRSAATAAATQTLYFPAGRYKLGSAVTFPSTMAVSFENGAVLVPQSGVIVTLDAEILAGAYQIFDITAGGSITG